MSSNFSLNPISMLTSAAKYVASFPMPSYSDLDEAATADHVDSAQKLKPEVPDEKKHRGQHDSVLTDEVVYEVDQIYKTILKESGSSITEDTVEKIESQLRAQLNNFLVLKKKEESKDDEFVANSLPEDPKTVIASQKPIISPIKGEPILAKKVGVLTKIKTQFKKIADGDKKKDDNKKKATDNKVVPTVNAEVGSKPKVTAEGISGIVEDAAGSRGTFVFTQEKPVKEDFRVNFFCHDSRHFSEKGNAINKGRNWVSGYIPIRATNSVGGFKRLTIALQMVIEPNNLAIDKRDLGVDKQVFGRKVAQLNLKSKTTHTLNTFRAGVEKYISLQNLSPSSVPPILDANENEGVIYLKYCRQGDLHDYVWNNHEEIAKNSPKIVLQMFEFYAKLHESGYIFGDTKPENFLLNDFNLFVTDFDTTKYAHTCGRGNELTCQQQKKKAKKADPLIPDFSSESLSESRRKLAGLAKQNPRGKSQEIPKEVVTTVIKRNSSDSKQYLQLLEQTYLNQGPNGPRLKDNRPKNKECPGEIYLGEGTPCYYSHNRLMDYLKMSSSESIIFSSQIDDLVAVGYVLYYMLNRNDSPFVGFALYALEYYKFMRELNPHDHAYALKSFAPRLQERLDELSKNKDLSAEERLEKADLEKLKRQGEELKGFEDSLEKQKSRLDQLKQELQKKIKEIEDFDCTKYLRGDRNELLKLKATALIKKINDSINSKGIGKLIIDAELYACINNARLSFVNKLNELSELTLSAYRHTVNNAKNLEKLGLVELLYNLFYETQLAQVVDSTVTTTITAASLLEKYRGSLSKFSDTDTAFKEFEKANMGKEKGVKETREPTLTRVKDDKTIAEPNKVGGDEKEHKQAGALQAIEEEEEPEDENDGEVAPIKGNKAKKSLDIDFELED